LVAVLRVTKSSVARMTLSKIKKKHKLAARAVNMKLRTNRTQQESETRRQHNGRYDLWFAQHLAAHSQRK
jgi:hypothetical protein